MMLKNIIRNRLRRFLGLNEFQCLQSAVIDLNSAAELRKVFSWEQQPSLDIPDLDTVAYLEDANERRLRDAESIATVMKNAAPAIALEIGTAGGQTTALMALNAPASQVYTINIPPEEIIAGEGGTFTTIALEREKIGAYYRERGLQNITQILVNSAKWVPNIGTIDVAFIDGCHDTDFVYNDSKKVLSAMRPGSFILWHDFNPSLVHQYPWIASVCRGVEQLLAEGLITGRILHVRDSWVGIHQVGKRNA